MDSIWTTLGVVGLSCLVVAIWRAFGIDAGVFALGVVFLLVAIDGRRG